MNTLHLRPAKQLSKILIVFYFSKHKTEYSYTPLAYSSGVLNSSPRDPLLCIWCMSPLFNTSDSDPQLMSLEIICHYSVHHFWAKFSSW